MSPRVIQDRSEAVSQDGRQTDQGGLKTVDRWHVPGSALGGHLIEGDDLTALAEHVAEWADLIEVDVHPVIEDAQAAEGASKAFGK